jgi:hypothetical protein
MGDPIDIGKILVGDTIRVVNPTSDLTFTVKEISKLRDDFWMVWHGLRAFGGRPGEGPEKYNTFYLVERPSQKNARMLTELRKGTAIPDDVLDYGVAPFLDLPPKKTKKGGRKTRRRKTRKSRR